MFLKNNFFIKIKQYKLFFLVLLFFWVSSYSIGLNLERMSFGSLYITEKVKKIHDSRIIIRLKDDFNSNQNLIYTQFTYPNEESFYPFHTPLSFIWLFTKESNILIFVIYFIYLLKIKSNYWCKYLFFVGLINILMTAMVYHIMIDKGRSLYKLFDLFNPQNKIGLNNLEHTIVPFLYIIFYFFIYKENISYNQIWIAWIHPSIYFICFFLYGYFNFSNLYNEKESTLEQDPCRYYPYPFFSPFSVASSNTSKEDLLNKQVSDKCMKLNFYYTGYKSVFICVVFLFLFVTAFSYIFCFLKDIY